MMVLCNVHICIMLYMHGGDWLSCEKLFSVVPSHLYDVYNVYPCTKLWLHDSENGSPYINNLIGSSVV